jgi:hypothetical protein
MAPSTSKILVGAPDRVTGAIMAAPVGSTLPTNATTAPDAAFDDLGYISEDGLSLSQASSWETIRDWGGDQVRKFLSDFTGTLSWTFLETNDDALEAMYGAANVTVTAAGASAGKLTAVKLNATEPVSKAWIFNMADSVAPGGDVARKVRIVVPIAQITERGDLSFSKNAAVMYPVTLEAYPDASGNSAYIYTDDGTYT